MFSVLLRRNLRENSRFFQTAIWCLALVLTALVVSCDQEGAGQSPAAKANPKARKFYWIQPLKGHPVHQLTQIAFKEGCKHAGYEFEMVGTETWDVGGTVALGEQVLARGDVAGLAIWTGNPAYNSFIEKAAKSGIPVVLPHFPAVEGSIPGATGIIGCDPAAYAREAAVELGKAMGAKGTVAVTQGSFNTTENLVSETFKKAMTENYPQVKVLQPAEEGFDPPGAIAKAVAILQGNPDVVAALSTTGGGPVTWANAQKETGRKLLIVGMDYTLVNLDLVKSGEVYAVIGQPLWEESHGAAELLARARRGEKIEWWTRLPAPFITRDKLGPYYALLDKVEAAIEK